MTEGFVQCFLNRPAAAMAAFETAMRLSPLDPYTFCLHLGVAMVHLAEGRYENAMESVDRSIREQSRWAVPVRYKVALCAHFGRIEEAREWLPRLLELRPGLTIAGFQTETARYLPPEVRAVLSEGLRKAGLPEQ